MLKTFMGYALWIEGDLAWAEGAHEYRAWGSAVVGVNTGFRLKDFRRNRGKRDRAGQHFVGLFASLEEVNNHLARRRLTARRGTLPHRKDAAIQRRMLDR